MKKPDSNQRRYPHLGSFLAALFLLGAIVALGVPNLRPPKGKGWNEAWNTLHFPGFFFLTLAIDVLVSKLPRLKVSRLLLVVGLALTIAVGSEYWQGMVGRSLSFQDLVFDLSGIAAGVFVIRLRTESRSRRSWILIVFGLLAGMLLLYCIQWIW